jgi:glycosyltransferase involved in cell wall biosynthesis
MTKPLHIGVLTADLTHKHGWAHYSLSLINALRRAGVRVTVVAARNSPDLANPPAPFSVRTSSPASEEKGEQDNALSILPTVDPLESGMLAGLWRARAQTRDALRECDIIHSLIEPYAPLAASIAGKRPLVVTGHGSYVRASITRRFPVNQLYARAFRRGLMVCVSQYTAQAAQQALPGIRTLVVPNGVDVERFAQLPSVPKRGVTVLSVGAVKARKGVLPLVHAMVEVRRQVPNAQCVIIGSLDLEPDYVAEVKAAVQRNGLQDAVHLLGRVPDDVLMEWYAAADVFALPSLNIGWKFEGFGLSLLEASAAGLPVVSTRGSGTEDAVDDGVTGLLVPQDDLDEALPAALIRLLSDRAVAVQMGAAGRKKAAVLTWDNTAQKLIEVYWGLMG